MKFVLGVDMGETTFDGKAVAELGRILRCWPAGGGRRDGTEAESARMATLSQVW
jgi:hypothetical protein